VRELYALNFPPAFLCISPRFAVLLHAFEESCLCDTRAGMGSVTRTRRSSAFTARGMREELSLATLLLTGDVMASCLRNSLLLKQRLAHARLDMLRGVGHMLFEEAPARTVDLVSAWLVHHGKPALLVMIVVSRARTSGLRQRVWER
jgi:hypothetical protein